MILDRYLIKEAIPNFFIGLLVFTFVMLMNQILVLAEMLITKGVDFIVIFLIIFYSLPALTVLTIPMSLLLGILLSFGRLNSDSEITVLRASGVSFLRLMKPMILLAIAGWVICAYLIQVSVPWANYSLSQLIFKIVTTNATSDLKPRVFYNQFRNMILYVQDIPSKEQLWRGVFIYDESQPDKARVVLAESGEVQQKRADNTEQELEIKLEEGSWHEVDSRVPQDYTFVYFNENVLPLPRPGKFNVEIPKNDREQTIPELKARVEEYKKKKFPTEFLEVEIHKKHAIPFACMVFAFLAVTLGVTSKKGTRSSAYAISIGIILVYYVLLIGGERMGDAGRISPWLGAWAANLVLGSFGIILFLKTNSIAVRKFLQSFGGYSFRIVTRTEAPIRTGRKVRIVIRLPRYSLGFFNLLDKYIVKEFIRNFVLILIALVLIAELIEATQLVDDLFRNKASVSVLFQYLKFNIPQWIFYVVPVTALTTTLVTFGTLTKNSEVIAMKSSGISLYRIALPIVIVAMFLSFFAFWLQDYILPITNKIAHNYKDALKGHPRQNYMTTERHWIAGADGFYNYDLFDLGKGRMFGFSIYQMDLDDFVLRKRIYAREAVYKNQMWQLQNGWQRTFDGTKVEYQTFGSMNMTLPVSPEFFTAEQQLPSEMNFRELKDYIVKMKQRGYDFVRFAVDLQAKVSFPTVSLILTLIAIPFSFTTGKRGALFGIGLSIVMGIIFWFFLALTKSLGYLEILNPFLAAWTPNILASMVALYLLFKLRT
jgi:LPS export ABC transporter permease LptG/LPS export ABC transporter permease LptF